jgi:hypothetical protein
MHLTRAVSPDRWDASRVPAVAPGDVALPPIAASLTICPLSSWRVILDGPHGSERCRTLAAATSRRRDGKCVGETENVGFHARTTNASGALLPARPPSCRPVGYGSPKVSRNPELSNRLFAPRRPNNACGILVLSRFHTMLLHRYGPLSKGVLSMNRILRGGIIFGLIFASLLLAPGLGRVRRSRSTRTGVVRGLGRPVARWRALQRPRGSA